MAQTKPPVGAKILVFRHRITTCASLTMRDRIEVAKWRKNACNFGYDRLVIHERAAGDPPEVGSFLSVYRRGEPWSRWGVTRMGDGIVAWCCITGTDVGRFATVESALLALLPESSVPPPAPPPIQLPHAARVRDAQLRAG